MKALCACAAKDKVLTSADVITVPSTGQTGLDDDELSLKHKAEHSRGLKHADYQKLKQRKQ